MRFLILLPLLFFACANPVSDYIEETDDYVTVIKDETSKSGWRVYSVNEKEILTDNYLMDHPDSISFTFDKVILASGASNPFNKGYIDHKGDGAYSLFFSKDDIKAFPWFTIELIYKD